MCGARRNSGKRGTRWYLKQRCCTGPCPVESFVIGLKWTLSTEEYKSTSYTLWCPGPDSNRHGLTAKGVLSNRVKASKSFSGVLKLLNFIYIAWNGFML